nr:double-strand break repair helicase AddA [Aestuariivirga litoralis]
MSASTEPKKLLAATPEQMRAADPEQSVWVSANAGSGKTHVLVERVIRLLLSGAAPDSILCITYTKAAAAEMSARLFKRLGSWTAMSDAELAEAITLMGADGHDKAVLSRARILFTEALETPGGLKIQTIHAFCERLLHLFPVEAGIAPGFRVMDQRDSDEMQENATREVLQLAESGTEPQLSAAFIHLADRLGEGQFAELIKSFVEALRKWDQGEGELTRETYEAALKISLGLESGHNWEDAKAAVRLIDRDAYLHHAEVLRPFAPHRNVNASISLTEIAQSESREAPLFKFYLTDKLEPRKELLAVKTRNEVPDTAFFLKAEQERLHGALQVAKTLEVIHASADALVLAAAILAHIENAKRTSGKYDFNDLISRTARLLASSRATQWVLYKLDGHLSHILLDEAQDTGPDQWKMIDALATEFFAGLAKPRPGPRTLFVVGDGKQSIYSFQGADVSAYGQARQTLVKPVGALIEVPLLVSYRSTDEILKAVDQVFSPDGKREHTASRKDDLGIVEIQPLVEADDRADDEPWTKPVDRPPASSPQRKLAARIAEKIASWLDPQHPRKLAGQNRAVQAGDILILFRSRGPLFRMVLAELRGRDVPVAGADRLNLLQSLIVQDVQMLLHWLLLPEDDHALAVILKSPLVPKPLTEEELFLLAYGRESQRLYDRLQGENRIWLDTLLSSVATETPFALMSSILDKSRKAIMARLGTEAIEASDAMLDLALDHERDHGPSLFGFLRWFASTETTIRRELEQDAGEVRLMTVHGAKGLEAPIVILADARAQGGGSKSKQVVLAAPGTAALPRLAGLPVWIPSGSKPSLPSLQDWLAFDETKQQLENERLLYVAMTRAADELYVFGHARKTRDDGTWWSTLTQKLGDPTPENPVRLGAADVHLEAGTTASKGGTVLPAWMKAAVLSESAPRPMGLTEAVVGEKNYDPAAAKRGRALHRLLEELADVPAAERLALAKSRAAKLGLTEATATATATSLLASEMQQFLTESSRGEVDIAGELPDGREVSGRIDRLTIEPEGIWILDYKTDRTKAHASDYAKQLAGYTALLQVAYPGRPITAAIFWTETARLEILPALHTSASVHT